MKNLQIYRIYQVLFRKKSFNFKLPNINLFYILLQIQDLNTEIVMFTRIFYILIYCSFLLEFPNLSQAADNDIIQQEKQGKLCPSKSKIIDINFWEEDLESSWYIAINYLSYMEKNRATLETNKDFLNCVRASFLRINYRLIDSADLQGQAVTVRRFEPLLAMLLDNQIFPIGSLWLKELSEIYADFDCDNGRMYIQNRESPPRFLTRLPSSYQGTYLLIGGERNSDNPHQDKFIINIDKKQNPDMLADGGSEHTFTIFPDNKFEEIFFDHIGHVALTGETSGDALQECYRILKVGSFFKFKTEHGPKGYYTDLLNSKGILSTIRAKLTEKGFSNVRVYLRKETNPEWTTNPFYIEAEAAK